MNDKEKRWLNGVQPFYWKYTLKKDRKSYIISTLWEIKKCANSQTTLLNDIVKKGYVLFSITSQDGVIYLSFRVLKIECTNSELQNIAHQSNKKQIESYHQCFVTSAKNILIISFAIKIGFEIYRYNPEYMHNYSVWFNNFVYFGCLFINEKHWNSNQNKTRN